MLKEPKIAKTIYLPEGLTNYINMCAAMSCRSFSGEIEYMLKKLKDTRDTNDAKAISMAEPHTPEQN